MVGWLINFEFVFDPAGKNVNEGSPKISENVFSLISHNMIKI